MSLQIDTNDVTSVLLVDGWHDVEVGTFDIDAYEFELRPGDIRQYKNATGVDGATWRSPDGETICCPLNQVLALKLNV